VSDEQAIDELTEELRLAHGGAVEALGRMMELSDPYTYGHQVRVGALSAQIAKKLDVDSELVDLIRQSGELHDIGKICLPLEILLRGEALSPQEYELIKRHPVAGYGIVNRARLPWPIAQVTLQHHERLDGSGYPEGLTGDEIILPAKIVAVADTVDAMANFRPYQPALGVKAALAHIEAGVGTHYDSDVSAACVAVFEAGYVFEHGGEHHYVETE
jgi:putative two-component system response regulator